MKARQGGSVKPGRSGDTPGGRAAGEIGIQAVRMGEVVGDHHVYLSLDQETITLSHHARSRDAFASGALTAARFAATAPTGRYGMEDVLGLGDIQP